MINIFVYAEKITENSVFFYAKKTGLNENP